MRLSRIVIGTVLCVLVGSCARFRPEPMAGCPPRRTGKFERIVRLATVSDPTLVGSVGLGRIIVRLFAADANLQPLEQVRVGTRVGSQNVLQFPFAADRVPGGYSATLPQGVVMIRTLRIGYKQVNDTVRVRPHFADTVAYAMVPESVCLTEVTTGP